MKSFFYLAWRFCGTWALILCLFLTVLVVGAVFWALAIVIGVPALLVLCVASLFSLKASPVPASPAPCGAGGASKEYMELIVGSRGHIFVFRIRDKASRDLLLPAVMRVAANEELPFDDDDAAEVMWEAVDAWGRADEIECRGK